MSKLTRVPRCRILRENTLGRDFVVGDLHGHRHLLEIALQQVAFDPRTDRVLAVGDLIDRGPRSLETLALIEEPWFHAVLGNHELRLLSQLGMHDSRSYVRRNVDAAGVAWISEALRKHRKTMRRLAEQVAELPLAIHVEGSQPFNVMHGDLTPLGAVQSVLFDGPTVCVHRADAATTSRANIGQLRRDSVQRLLFGDQSVEISGTPMGPLPLTYVGHSPLSAVTVHQSYVYIDQRVGDRPGDPMGPRLPTLLEHSRFAWWINGVAHVRGGRLAMADGCGAASELATPAPRGEVCVPTAVMLMNTPSRRHRASV